MVDWDATFILALMLAAGIGYATCLYRYCHRSAELSSKAPIQVPQPPKQLKHRLQLLFDSYSNESIDHFIQALEVTPQTLPVHIAVGRHYRQQGEVDKAILIHQNLVAHPELLDAVVEPIIYELAKDYRKAGLLDRAETLLVELGKSTHFALKSQVMLMEIYEQEKDWSKAIATALNSDFQSSSEVSLRLAHYYCEQAVEADSTLHTDYMQGLYRQALAISKNCVRAEQALAQIFLADGDFDAAFASACRIGDVAGFELLALPILESCLSQSEIQEKAVSYLIYLYQKLDYLPILALLIQHSRADLDNVEAVNTLERQLLQALEKSPDAQTLRYLFESSSFGQALQEPLRRPLLNFLDRQIKEHKAYQCEHCGFAGSQLYWHCPGCFRWQSIRPALAL